MRKTIHAAAVIAASLAASFTLAGCPTQPSYQSTITPIYAATSVNGLWVFNGTSWTNYPSGSTGSGLTGVVVFGSGARASVLAGGTTGVKEFNGSAWSATTGLGAGAVASLTSSSSVLASTAGGLSILNPDGATWTNNAAVTPLDAFSSGTFTFVAEGAAGLVIYNGTGQAGSPVSAATIVPASTIVTSVFIDAFGDLIAGTDRGMGVQLAGTSSWVQPLPVVSVSRLYADSFGNLYAVTASGLYVVGSTAFLALPGTVQSVCVDGAGTIYAGTSTGLMVSKDGGFSWTTQLSGQNITAVATTAPLYSF